MQMGRRHCPRLVNLGLGSFDKPLSDWWGPDSSNVCVHFHRLTSSLRSESRAWITADLLPPPPTPPPPPPPPLLLPHTHTHTPTRFSMHTQMYKGWCLQENAHTREQPTIRLTAEVSLLYPQSRAGGRMQSAHSLAAWICHVEVNWYRL